MKPQVVTAHAEQVPGRRRHHRLRLRHRDDVGGALPQDARQHDVSASGMLATMANGLPYAVGAAIGLSRPAGGLLRRRRRLHHADGRDGHHRQVQAAGQGHHHQEQHAGPDQVGADGHGGQPAVRRRAAADRLRQVTPEACGAAGFTIDDPAKAEDDAAPGVRRARAGRDRGGGRSQRAADAGPRHHEAGLALRQVAGPAARSTAGTSSRRS